MPAFFFNDTATTEIYTLSLHDALPVHRERWGYFREPLPVRFHRHRVHGTAGIWGIFRWGHDNRDHAGRGSDTFGKRSVDRNGSHYGKLNFHSAHHDDHGNLDQLY